MARRALFCLICLSAGLVVGCVERKLTIRSEPSGAEVVLDGKVVGTTPCTIEFTHYGTRSVVLSKEGFQRKREYAKIRPPYYQRFPLDLFFELIWPITLVDHQELIFRLEPLGPSDTSHLDARAAELQKKLETLTPR